MSALPRRASLRPLTLRLTCVWLLLVARPASASTPEATRLLAEVKAALAQGRAAEALPLAQRALELTEGLGDAGRTLRIDALATLGEAAAAVGQLDLAVTSLERAVKASVELVGEASPETAILRLTLGDALIAAEQHPPAFDQFTRGLSVVERAVGPSHLLAIQIVEKLSALADSLGDPVTARQHKERALAAYLTVMTDRDPLVHESLYRLGTLCRKIPDLEAAKTYFTRALAARLEVLGPTHFDVLETRHGLGLTLLDLGDVAQAKREFELALEGATTGFGRDSEEAAKALHNLGFLHLRVGALEPARKALDEALRLRRKYLPPNDPDIARVLLSLGALAHLQGDLRLAKNHFESCVSIFETSLGQGSETASALNNLGGVHLALGDLSRALPLLESASKLNFERSPRLPETGVSLHNLAHLLHLAGRHEDAAAFAKRALDILGASPDDPRFADALLAAGEIARARGAIADGRSLTERAHAIYARALGAGHVDTARALNNLAFFDLVRHDTARAQTRLAQALAVFETQRPQGFETARILDTLGLLAMSAGDIPQAAPLLARSQQLDEALLASLLLMGSERQKRIYAETFEAAADLRMALATLHPTADAVRTAFEAVLTRKGRVLEASIDQMAGLRRGLDVSAMKVLDDLVAARGRLATLSLNPDSTSAEVVSRLRAEAEVEAQTLEQRLADISEQYAAARRSVTASALAKALPKNTALIEFVIFRRPAFSPGLSFESATVDHVPASLPALPEDARYLAFVFVGDRPQMRDLGPVAAIDEAALAFRKSLAERKGAPRVKALALLEKSKRLGRSLDALVLEPVIPLIGEAKTLVIAPDGELNQVPFEALVDPAGRWRTEAFGTSYLTGGRELVRLAAKTAPSQTGPVALGGVDFEGGGAAVVAARSTAMVDLRFGPLPGTVDEVRAMSSLPLFARGVPLLGPAATESALRALRGPRILHLATHGFFLPAAAAEKGLAEDPMLRSGLALAGVNARADGLGDDGVLTALEASSLDLGGTELVAMSACETGLGENRRGDGVIGLRRAIALAGARTLVMSLWKVDDDATSAMMQAYYARLARGEGRAEAMRAIRLAMIADAERAEDLLGASPAHGAPSQAWSHPYYWASFLVSGDPRPLPR